MAKNCRRPEAEDQDGVPQIQGHHLGDQGKLNRFVETNEKNYDVIRDTAKALKLYLSKMKSTLSKGLLLG